MSAPLIVSEGPFVHPQLNWSTFNLLTGAWVTGTGPDYKAGSYMKLLPNESAGYFTPEALAGDGVR
ncbi:hypothetical protein D3C85_1817140 [compost metagenome]